MENTNIITIILIGTSIALLTELTFLTKKPFAFTNLIVILFMIALVSPMLVKLVTMLNLLPYVPVFEFFRASPFTFGPFLYFYAKAETGLISKFSRRDILHFTPFIAAIIITVLCGPPDKGAPHPIEMMSPGVSQSDAPFVIPEPLHSGDNFPDQMEEKHKCVWDGFRILGILMYVSMTVYTILIIRLIRKHNKGINDYFSIDTIEINLKWITWITVCFLLSYLFVMADAIFYFGHGSDRFSLLIQTPDLATTFFIFMFSYFSLKQPPIYKVAGSNNNSFSTGTKEEKRYEKSGLKEETAEKYHRQIIEYMAKEKPYTDPDITINSLSEKLGIPRHHLTQVINEKSNRNFFMFINDYRISEVKEQISLDVLNEHSILRIAYDAGFNSKSTFNTMFKKSTGMTPSEYRKTINIK